MKILFLDSILRDITSSSFYEMPSHEQIGQLLSTAMMELPADTQPIEVPLTFQRLGIAKDDKDAYETMERLLRKVKSCEAHILATKDSGVYHICTPQSQEPLMVFKIGHKRTAKETLVRKVFHRLGLSNHVVPSIYAALRDPQIQTLSKTVEELWNGRQKWFIESEGRDEPSSEYSDVSDESSVDMSEQWFSSVQQSPPHSNPSSQANSQISSQASSATSSPKKGFDPQRVRARSTETTPHDSPAKRSLQSKSGFSTARKRLEFSQPHPKAIVGLLQPYLPKSEETMTPYQCVLVTMGSLACGLRDIKDDGLVHDVLVDVEDCMPTRIDPPVSQDMCEVVSATHLPFLDFEPMSRVALSSVEVLETQKLVAKWDVDALISELAQEKILFEDKKAEASDKAHVDDGHCAIKIHSDESCKHLVNGRQNKDSAHNPDRKMLAQEELSACRTRLERIKSFIQSTDATKTSFTAQDLVFGVDRHAERFYKALTTPPTNESLRSSVGSMLSRGRPFNILGHVTPRYAGITQL